MSFYYIITCFHKANELPLGDTRVSIAP